MTIDERLEKLTERHEALTQSVDLLAREMESLRIASFQLVESAKEDGRNIRALARIAEIHERRITDIEGSAQN